MVTEPGSFIILGAGALGAGAILCSNGMPTHSNTSLCVSFFRVEGRTRSLEFVRGGWSLHVFSGRPNRVQIRYVRRALASCPRSTGAPLTVDRCAGGRLAEWLREQGHDAAESAERGEDPGDVVILGWAATEQRILVTMHKDFGELVFKGRQTHFGLVRLPTFRSRIEST